MQSERKIVTIDWTTAVEALRAFEALKADKDSYIHKVMSDDASFIIYAIRDLRRAIEDGEK